MPALSKKHLKVFRDWLALVGIDIMLMVCLSLVTLILKLDHQIFRQSKMIFPMRYSRVLGWYGPTDISYPQRPLILSNLTTGIIFTAIPIAVIVGMQAFVRSFWDANAAILGLLNGLVLMYVPNRLCSFDLNSMQTTPVFDTPSVDSRHPSDFLIY